MPLDGGDYSMYFCYKDAMNWNTGEPTSLESVFKYSFSAIAILKKLHTTKLAIRQKFFLYLFISIKEDTPIYKIQKYDIGFYQTKHYTLNHNI
jgi:hypothetical protein